MNLSYIYLYSICITQNWVCAIDSFDTLTYMAIYYITRNRTKLDTKSNGFMQIWNNEHEYKIQVQ